MDKEDIKNIEYTLNLNRIDGAWVSVNGDSLEKLYNRYKEQEKQIEDLNKVIDRHDMWEEIDYIVCLKKEKELIYAKTEHDTNEAWKEKIQEKIGKISSELIPLYGKVKTSKDEEWFIHDSETKIEVLQELLRGGKNDR